MWRRNLTISILVAVFVLVFRAQAADEPAVGTFDAVAEVTSPEGTRSLPITISVTTPFTIQDAAFFRETLDQGGQQALLNAIRYSYTGRLLLGTIEYPINIIVAERIEEGWRYTIVTARNVSWQEYQLKEPSLDFPFTAAQFEIEDDRHGEGKIAPRAALSIGEDGEVTIETFEGTIGKLKEIKRR